MNTTIKAAKVGERWVAFAENADLAQYDETKIVDWIFTGRDCTTGTLIRVSDGIVAFDLARDSLGYPDAAAYASAYDISFAVVHLAAVAGPNVQMDAPTRKQVETLPPAILRQYVYRTDTSRSVTKDEINSLRKPKQDKANTEEPESAEKKD